MSVLLERAAVSRTSFSGVFSPCCYAGILLPVSVTGSGESATVTGYSLLEGSFPGTVGQNTIS